MSPPDTGGGGTFRTGKFLFDHVGTMFIIVPRPLLTTGGQPPPPPRTLVLGEIIPPTFSPPSPSLPPEIRGETTRTKHLTLPIFRRIRPGHGCPSWNLAEPFRILPFNSEVCFRTRGKWPQVLQTVTRPECYINNLFSVRLTAGRL